MIINMLGMGYLGVAYSTWLASRFGHHINGVRWEDWHYYAGLEDSLRNPFYMHLGGGSISDRAFDPNASVFWVTIDTPIDDRGRADVEPVFTAIAGMNAPAGTPIIVSSQLPVGSTKRLETLLPENPIAYVPENVSVGRAMDYLSDIDRVVVGTRADLRNLFERLFDGRPTDVPLFFMSPESAEMVKHGINSLLACCIAFANELGDKAQMAGADLDDVYLGMISEYRIGGRGRLPIKPGGPFKTGHLERDLEYLTKFATRDDLLRAIVESNNKRR